MYLSVLFYFFRNEAILSFIPVIILHPAISIPFSMLFVKIVKICGKQEEPKSFCAYLWKKTAASFMIHMIFYSSIVLIRIVDSDTVNLDFFGRERPDFQENSCINVCPATVLNKTSSLMSTLVKPTED